MSVTVFNPAETSWADTARETESCMDQAQYDRIATILYRISDSNERDEVVREVARVLAEAGSGFDTQRFYQLANVSYLEDR